MNGYQNHFTQPSFGASVQSKGKEVATEQWDDSAFERVFDQVSDALIAEQEAMDVEREAYTNGISTPYQRGASTGNALETDTLETQQHHLDHFLMEHLPRHDRLQRTEPDTIADEMLREDLDSAMDSAVSEAEQQQQQHDDDALALTAQELLEKVEHNQTDKFKNSQFLSLMRKLRDREMKVEGNEMVSTNVRAAPFNPLTKATPRTLSPDSAYVSGTSSPHPYINPYIGGYPVDYHHGRSSPPEFDSHYEYGWDQEHEFDHWESPYR